MLFCYHINKTLPLCALLSKKNPVHALPSCSVNIHFNIIFSYTPRSSCRSSHQKPVAYAFLFSPKISTCPSHFIFLDFITLLFGRATRYGLDGPCSEYRGGEIFRTHPNLPWGPSSLLCNGYRVSFPGIKRPGRGVIYPPPSSVELKKEYSYNSTPPLGLF
jgi:hypothetical protein